MTVSNLSHVLLLAIPAWGHVRPLLLLGCRLVVAREDVVVTYLLPPSMLKKAATDLSRHVEYPPMARALHRIRLVATFDDPELYPVLAAQQFSESYRPYYEALLETKPIRCAVTGTVIPPVPAPKVLIMDFFAYPQMMASRAITGRSVPIITFASVGAASMIRLFGPEHIGGRGDFGALIDEEVARTGQDPIQVGEKIYAHTEGKVIKVPGLPPMYDYEIFPQFVDLNLPLASLVRVGYSSMEECDGAIIMTCPSYDNSGSLEAFKSWMAEKGRTGHAISPLLPFDYGLKSALTTHDCPVDNFLSDILNRFGKSSLTLISFGTIFFPSNPEYIEVMIDTFIAKQAPFIFCYASPLAKISDDILRRISASGLGYATTWSPQQFILSHPATGTFLTHGGSGSTTEALANGIPLILWPIEADQPIAAAHLCDNLGVGIELFEVRTGDHARKPILRNGRIATGTCEAVGQEIGSSIETLRGPAGALMRANAQRIRFAYAHAWKPGGEGVSALKEFCDAYIP